MLLRVLVATSVIALFGCAHEDMSGSGDSANMQTADNARQCFYNQQITGFSDNEDHSVVINVGVNDHYLLTTRGVCTDLYRTQSLQVVNRGSGHICAGENALGVDLVTPEARCGVKSITRLPDAPSGSKG